MNECLRHLAGVMSLTTPRDFSLSFVTRPLRDANLDAWVLFFVTHLSRLSGRPVCLQTVCMDSDRAPPMVSLLVFCPSASCVLACNCKPLTSSSKSIPLYYRAVISETLLAVDRDLGCFQHLLLRVPL